MDKFQQFYTHIQKHPFSLVKHLIGLSIKKNELPQDISLQLSKYRYTPQSFIDDRSGLTLPFKQFNEKTLYDIIEDMNGNEELAFHSLVNSFGSSYHFPLIDFGKVDRGVIDTNPLRELSEHWQMSFFVYNSGRSFHAYGNRLIKSSDWIAFMGSLLLLNKPSGFKLIDERWIGHRLMAGYGALRWTNNSSHYKKNPTFVGYLSSSGLEWMQPDKISSLLPQY
ncbi:hypothetical protein F3I35_12030 [Pantoea sp. Bo_7]|uniref:primase 1D-like protein n=1 Tax=unclassified Pantoea TaxID=2630326 RepID=UPI001231B6AD|nr:MULTISPECIES: hypothetical protein [unclassified Pantoea]KAA6045440.1 hypothetical protein F3I35_12030 [Pantoea sp. Bo_7]KAA6090788.1 hypothetical protein F3I22_12035 [Pantoea sp. Bo_10]